MEKEGTIQKELIETGEYEKLEDEMHISFKQVNNNDIVFESDFKKQNRNQLVEVLDSMYVSEDYIDFDECNLSSNCRQWIEELLFDKINIYNNLKYLINDFSDSMNTNMRKKEMYVVSILTRDKLILVHSRMGEKSIDPSLKVFPRMLDKDNLKRYVSFEKKSSKIRVRHYELYKSNFFVGWLGITQKELKYKFGGKNSFYSEIGGITVSLEITDKQFEELIEGKNGIKIIDSNLIFDDPVNELGLSQIKRGKEEYKTIIEFKRDHTSRRFGLKHYKEEYNKLISSFNPSLIKIYDCELEVSNQSKEYYLKKNNPNVEILFCNNEIDMLEEYVEKFKIKLINNQKIKIIHAGIKLKEDPLKINKLEIYNEINDNLSNPLINYLNDYGHSESFKKDLIFGIINTLIRDNPNSPIKKFFISLKKKFEESLGYSSSLSENDVIELKSRDFVEADQKKFILKLTEDINNKLTHFNYKFYILGYDEDTKLYEPFTDRYDDSRLNDLNKHLQKSLKIENVHLFKAKYGNKKCILMLSVKK